MRDQGGDYEAVKSVLLKAVGETSLTYGHQLFELSGEFMKAKSAGEIVEVIERICRGVMQGCESMEDAVVALAMALTRKMIPPGGKVFLENRKITRMEELREAWEHWMAGRQKGNFYKAWISSGMGESSRGYHGSGSSGAYDRGHLNSYVTCFNCGEKGHRSTECKTAKSNGGNRTSEGGPSVRPITCFNCGKSGHRSVDCPNRKVGGVVKKEPVFGRVAKIVVGAKKKGNVAWNLVNGVRGRILVDSGAEVGKVLSGK